MLLNQSVSFSFTATAWPNCHESMIGGDNPPPRSCQVAWLILNWNQKQNIFETKWAKHICYLIYWQDKARCMPLKVCSPWHVQLGMPLGTTMTDFLLFSKTLSRVWEIITQRPYFRNAGWVKYPKYPNIIENYGRLWKNSVPSSRSFVWGAGPNIFRFL